MGGRERNAAGLKSGNAVAHSAPVLTKPTSPEHPVESRRLSSVQPKSGRGSDGYRALGGSAQLNSGRGSGRSPEMLAAPIQLGDDDIAKLAELFSLLDGWDRKGSSCRLCLIACNSRRFDEVDPVPVSGT